MNMTRAMIGALLLAGCAAQSEAPVVSGYDKGRSNVVAAVGNPTSFTNRVAARGNGTVVASQPVAPRIESEELNDIAPAAGPVTTRTVTPVAANSQPVAVRANWQAYRVEKSDTIYKISRKFNTTPREIMDANRMASSAEIAEGQTLMVPVDSGRIKNPTSFMAKLDSSLPPPQTRTVTSQPAVVQPTAEVIEPAAGPATTRTYVQEQPVSGGHRYSLTRHQMEAAPAKKAGSDTPDAGEGAAIEPAAGEKQTTTNAKTIAPSVSTMDHKVQKGETVYRIALKYQASVFDIMAANNFDKPQDLQAGMVVKVPVANGASAQAKAEIAEAPTDSKPVELQKTVGQLQEVASVEPAVGVKGQRTMQDGAIAGPSSEDMANEMAPVVNKQSAEETATSSVKAAMKKGYVDSSAARAKGMAWPVKGKVIKTFGQEGQGVMHSGINIAVPLDTPVLAADRGTVLYAGSGLKTYGNLVLLRHEGGLVSAYAHNGVLLVKKGDVVKKGQVVALSGNSGNVDVPQVHFEVRRNARALNPMGLLAAR